MLAALGWHLRLLRNSESIAEGRRQSGLISIKSIVEFDIVLGSNTDFGNARVRLQ